MVGGFGWEWFIKEFYQMSSIDLKAYKRPQMERRINSFMRSVEVSDYAGLIKLCEHNPRFTSFRRAFDHKCI